MATSSQSVPNVSRGTRSGDDGEDELQAFTPTADWSNVLWATDPLSQSPIGPLDPELAGYDDLFSPGSPHNLTFDLDCEKRYHSSSPAAPEKTDSSRRKLRQITISDKITPPAAAMPEEFSKSHRNAKEQRRHTSLDSSLDGNNTEVITKEENWHVTTRERNRIAASKCRRKKRLEEKDMEEMRRSLELHNAILQDTASNLREEVLSLKNEILRHGTCDFPPIQNYVLAAASQIHGGYNREC